MRGTPRSCRRLAAGRPRAHVESHVVASAELTLRFDATLACWVVEFIEARLGQPTVAFPALEKLLAVSRHAKRPGCLRTMSNFIARVLRRGFPREIFKAIIAGNAIPVSCLMRSGRARPNERFQHQHVNSLASYASIGVHETRQVAITLLANGWTHPLRCITKPYSSCSTPIDQRFDIAQV